MDGRATRVGVLIDSASLPRWSHRVVADLATSDPARLAVVVQNGRPGRPAGRRRWSLFAAYEALDRRFSGVPDDYADPVDASALLEPFEHLTVLPQQRAGFQELPAPDVEAIRAMDLDVLLQLGFGHLGGDLLGAARHGVWVLWHDELERRGIPPLFWEMLRGDSSAAAGLEARTPLGTRLLYRSAASMERSSLYLNRNAAYSKSSEFVSRALRGLEAGRPAPVPTTRERETLPARGPNALETLRFMGSVAARILRNRMQMRGARCEWLLALRPKGAPPWHTARPSGFEELVNPPGRFRTDPFLLRSGGATWLFFEEAKFATEKGVIGCMEVGPDGTCSEARVVLERDYHLSYPFVFMWDGGHYMIPETSENRTIELYRATDFPHRWELDRVLFRDVFAVDTTLLEADGRFWLFSAMSVAGGSGNDELFLFHSDSPRRSWTPHPMNPIVSDVHCARPAGRIFRHDGGVGHFVPLYFTVHDELRGWALGRVVATKHGCEAALVTLFAPQPDAKLYGWMVSEAVTALSAFRPNSIQASSTCPLLSEALGARRFLRAGQDPVWVAPQTRELPGPVAIGLDTGDTPLLPYPERWWGDNREDALQ